MTTLLGYLAAAVANHPNHDAVIDEHRTLTYRELDKESDAVASHLAGLGAAPGERVGIQLPPGVDLVVAVWAVLKTGAAYVPLDPSSPTARLDIVLQRIAPIAVIVGDIAQRPSASGIITVDLRHATRTDADLPSFSGPVADDIAYILHTSGSTGVPKGVVLTHRNATAFAEWAVTTFHITSADRIAGHAPAHFDLSTFDLFGAARSAATLIPIPPRAKLFPAELAAFLQRSASTVLYCVPSALTMLTNSEVATSENLSALRVVLFAGEICPQSTLRALRQIVPQARMANLYGPTETNVCTYHEVDPAVDLQRPVLPIGRPITGEVTTVVMASAHREAASGEPGELYVGGPTVARGYWGASAQTAERFVSHPITGRGRLYRTGDIVIRGEDGLLYFHGRADRQIKTRGHRVELDEVESVVRDHPEVIDAAVLALPDDTITHRVVAVVVTRRPITPAVLRRAYSTHLPGYMVPSDIRILPALPRTSTGKIDRHALSGQFTVSPSP